MSRRALLSLCALAAGGCEPGSASISEGVYTAWLAELDSLTIFRDRIDLEGYDNYVTLDCRDSSEGERLPNPIRVCPEDTAGEWPPVYETWLSSRRGVQAGSTEEKAWHVINADLSPWRGEAVITSEGDFQLGWHDGVPGGGDMEFIVTIDPDFQPRSCTEVDNPDDPDNPDLEFLPIDGDWVENWSQDLDNGGTLFFVNSGSYQFDPAAPTPRQQFLPDEWRAGYGQAQLVDDDFVARSNLFGDPSVWIEAGQLLPGLNLPIDRSDLFYCNPAQSSLTPPDCGAFGNSFFDTPAELRADVEDIAATVGDEFERYGANPRPDLTSIPGLTPRVHDNLWREPDDRTSGIDGWMELSYSWVAFDPGAEFEAGGRATGTLYLFYDGLSFSSRLLVRASFEVNGWERDTWTTEFLPPRKFEENDSDLCGVTAEDGRFVIPTPEDDDGGQGGGGDDAAE